MNPAIAKARSFCNTPEARSKRIATMRAHHAAGRYAGVKRSGRPDVEIECTRCHNPFTVRYGLRKRLYCSRHCSTEARRPTGMPTGLTDAQRDKWKYNNIPVCRIARLLRERIRKVLKGGIKAGRTRELIGCSTKHFLRHIEARFTAGMTWQNMGIGDGKWNIDHRIPCASFDLIQPKQQRACFHWTNLQPMWSLDNLRKGARILS